MTLPQLKKVLHENDLNSNDSVEFAMDLFQDGVIILDVPGARISLSADRTWTVEDNQERRL